MNRVDDIKRSPEKMRRILSSYARNQGTQITYETIADDIKINEDESITSKTISSYLDVLKKMYVIEDLPAWNPNLRSKTAIRTTDTRYFTDSSIATAALRISPNDLINDMRTFGFLFETMAIHDLRVYSEALDGSLYHYRDKNNLDCDAVIHLRNGKYGLIEIKLGGDKAIEEGANNLLKLSSIINTDKTTSLSFMMVLTGINNISYQRKDGVYVVPSGTLGI